MSFVTTLSIVIKFFGEIKDHFLMFVMIWLDHNSFHWKVTDVTKQICLEILIWNKNIWNPDCKFSIRCFCFCYFCLIFRERPNSLRGQHFLILILSWFVAVSFDSGNKVSLQIILTGDSNQVCSLQCRKINTCYYHGSSELHLCLL